MTNERYEKWYAEAKKQTLETLPAFMKKILDEPHDYSSIVEAVAACAVGAAWAADRHDNGGITGFQGSGVMWRFIQSWMRLEDSCGLRIINYDDMLYPQYEDAFTKKTINKETWNAMQKKATELWLEGGGTEEVRDQRSAYVMLLKENKDVTVQNQLYKNIVKYNSKLRKNKHYSKSPWTNWFYAKEWEDLEYIEIIGE